MELIHTQAELPGINQVHDWRPEMQLREHVLVSFNSMQSCSWQRPHGTSPRLSIDAPKGFDQRHFIKRDIGRTSPIYTSPYNVASQSRHARPRRRKTKREQLELRSNCAYSTALPLLPISATVKQRLAQMWLFLAILYCGTIEGASKDLIFNDTSG